MFGLSNSSDGRKSFMQLVTKSNKVTKVNKENSINNKTNQIVEEEDFNINNTNRINKHRVVDNSFCDGSIFN
jgi:hypothetical protein